MGYTAKVRKWGNSMGIIIPKEAIEEKNIKTDDEISIEIIKVADLRKVFGSLKMKKNAQQIKDEARKEWSKERRFS